MEKINVPKPMMMMCTLLCLMVVVSVGYLGCGKEDPSSCACLGDHSFIDCWDQQASCADIKVHCADLCACGVATCDDSGGGSCSLTYNQPEGTGCVYSGCATKALKEAAWKAFCSSWPGGKGPSCPCDPS